MLSVTIIISILICSNCGVPHHASNAIQDVDDIYYEIYGDEVDDSSSYLTDLYEHYSDALLGKANYYLELFEWFRSNYQQTSPKSSTIQPKNDLYQSTKHQHSPRSQRKKKSVSTNGYRGYDNNYNGFASKLVDYSMNNGNGGVEVAGGAKKQTGGVKKQVHAKVKPHDTMPAFSQKQYEALKKAEEEATKSIMSKVGIETMETLELFPNGAITEKDEAETADSAIKEWKTSIGGSKYTIFRQNLHRFSTFMRTHTESVHVHDRSTTVVIFQRHCTSRQNAFKIYPARDSMPTFKGSRQLLEAKRNAGPAIKKALNDKKINRWQDVLDGEYETHMSPLSRATLTALILEQAIIEQIAKGKEWNGKFKDELQFRERFNMYPHYFIESGLQEDGGLPSQQGPKFRQAVKRLIEARGEPDATKREQMIHVAQDTFSAWLDNKWPEPAADASSWWGKVLKGAYKKVRNNHGFVDLGEHIPDVRDKFLTLDGTNVESMKATEDYWQKFSEMFRKMHIGSFGKKLPKAKIIKVAEGEGQEGRKNWLLSLKERNVVFAGGHSNSLRRMFLGDATKTPQWVPYATQEAREKYLAYTKNVDPEKPDNEKIPNSTIVMFVVDKNGEIIDFKFIWHPTQKTGL